MLTCVVLGSEAWETRNRKRARERETEGAVRQEPATCADLRRYSGCSQTCSNTGLFCFDLRLHQNIQEPASSPILSPICWRQQHGHWKRSELFPVVSPIPGGGGSIFRSSHCCEGPVSPWTCLKSGTGCAVLHSGWVLSSCQLTADGETTASCCWGMTV